ncbi:MAG: hypothetical protein BroJett030_06990 [Alphaproteobacteria bacterium]|nr:MAG: hypothetical protein BroJett030_06990 [Alphaproteobacteria bacterium]
MRRGRRPSGMEQLPPVFSRPLWKDAFFRLTVAMACLWALAIAWLVY